MSSILFVALSLLVPAVSVSAADLLGLHQLAESMLGCNDHADHCDGSDACDGYDARHFHHDDSATYNEFEFASITDLGWIEMENRTILNVADLPGTIRIGPTNPGDLP